MLMPTVNYLRVIGCEHVAVKGVERDEGRLQDRPPNSQEKFMKAYLDNNKLTRKWALHARMSHSTVCNTTVSTKKTHHTPVKK